MIEAGIALCGGYLPTYRFNRNLIAGGWDSLPLGGERTLAGNAVNSPKLFWIYLPTVDNTAPFGF